MAATKQIILKIAADVAALKSSLNQSRSHISAFAGQVKGMMATAFSVYTVVNFAKNLVNLQAEYSHTISFVNTLTKATTEQKVALDELNKRLGRDTPYTTTQSAEAMQILALSGLDVNEIVGTLPGVLELAQAGNMDFAKSADIATGAMYAFGKEATDMGHINDILVNTANSSRQSVEDVGETLKYAAQFAHTANQSFEDIAAMTLVLANHMVRGTQAGTGLSQAMATLIDPSEKAKRILGNLNIQVFDKMTGKMRSMIDIFRQLKAANVTPSEIAAIFTQRGTKVASVLVDFIDELDVATGTVKEWGTATKTATERADNLWGDIKRLQSAWEKLNYTITDSQVGFLREFTQGLSNAIIKVDNAITPLNKLKKAWDDLATTLGRPVSNVMEWLFGSGPAAPGVVGAANTAADFAATMKAAEWDIATRNAKNKPLVRKGTWQETETGMLLRALRGELTEEEKLAEQITKIHFEAFKERSQIWELEQRRVDALNKSYKELATSVGDIDKQALEIINSPLFTGYFGPAVDTGNLMPESADTWEGSTQKWAEDLMASIQYVQDEAATAAVKIKDRLINISEVASEGIRQVMQGGLTALGEMLGGGVDNKIKDGFDKIMVVVYQFIKSFGEAMIAVGLAKIAFDKLMISPYLAIAAGVALVALATAGTRSINKKYEDLVTSGVPGTSNYGLSHSNKWLTGGYSGNPTLRADVRGDTLQFALDENNRKQM